MPERSLSNRTFHIDRLFEPSGNFRMFITRLSNVTYNNTSVAIVVFPEISQGAHGIAITYIHGKLSCNQNSEIYILE